MKIHFTIALSLLAGAALGAAGIHGLHAQATPPSLYVVDISDVTDPEALRVVTQRPTGSTATVMQGGRYMARTDKITALDGTPPKRFVVIAFDNLEKLKAFKDSAAQKEIDAVRLKATKSRSFIVEGM